MKYLTFVDNINTFNLKNHQVLKLKFPSIMHWQWIYSRGGPTGSLPGSDRVKFCCCFIPYISICLISLITQINILSEDNP